MATLSVDDLNGMAKSMAKSNALAHYGKKGMRWGVRNAAKEVGLATNARQTSANVKIATKQNFQGKALNKVMGQKRFDSMMEKRVTYLKDERQRIESGKTTLNDKISLYQRTTLKDIGVGLHNANQKARDNDS